MIWGCADKYLSSDKYANQDSSTRSASPNINPRVSFPVCLVNAAAAAALSFIKSLRDATATALFVKTGFVSFVVPATIVNAFSVVVVVGCRYAPLHALGEGRHWFTFWHANKQTEAQVERTFKREYSILALGVLTSVCDIYQKVDLSLHYSVLSLHSSSSSVSSIMSIAIISCEAR